MLVVVDEYEAPGAWIVVADAGRTGPEREKLWGPMVLAWMLHWQTTGREPSAEGAAYVRSQTVNRAEHLAVVAGLRALREGLELGPDWRTSESVHVLTDSALVVKLMTGVWIPGEMRRYCDAIKAEADRLEKITGKPVTYRHADRRLIRRAHGLVRWFGDQRGYRAEKLYGTPR